MTTNPTLQPVLIVLAILLGVFVLYKWRQRQPSIKEVLNDVFSHPEPVHKLPVQYIVEKCVPKPVSDEELRAVVDAHKSGAGPLAGVSLTPYSPPGSAATPTGGTPASPASATSAAPPAAGASTPAVDPVLAAALSKLSPPK